MIVWNSTKFACDKCQTGHRNAACDHLNRPLNEIRSKGRPITQCQFCRAKRKQRIGQSHHRCLCGGPPETPILLKYSSGADQETGSSAGSVAEQPKPKSTRKKVKVNFTPGIELIINTFDEPALRKSLEEKPVSTLTISKKGKSATPASGKKSKIRGEEEYRSASPSTASVDGDRSEFGDAPGSPSAVMVDRTVEIRYLSMEVIEESEIGRAIGMLSLRDCIVNQKVDLSI
ncbi:hypothetical protein HDV05_008330 [Chytridiales sp. JEL 0842]|nr:hypothetical protein HDV05_008330 [Chytridiales sp. JEL 0842]